LEGEKYVTISLLPMCVEEVRSKLKEQLGLMQNKKGKEAVCDLIVGMIDDCDMQWGSALGYTSQTEKISHNEQIGCPTILLWVAMLDPCTKQMVSKLLNLSSREQLQNDIKSYVIEKSSNLSGDKEGCEPAVHKNVEKGKTEDLENGRAINSLGEFTACYSSDDDSASPTTSSHISKEID
jgi:hypothetical protein